MSLLKLLDRKFYKTGQTRGADDDQIFQNRVLRNSCVLIPLAVWEGTPGVRSINYENGTIVLVPPDEYFENGGSDRLKKSGLSLGQNALIFYEQRSHWNQYPPGSHKLTIPNSRTAPLGGQYAARIANTTASGDKRINHGYTESKLKGAGIRQYEYAPQGTIKLCRIQLEALFWLSPDSVEATVQAGLAIPKAEARKKVALENATRDHLLDYDKLMENRIINKDHELVCPLCLETVSSFGFLNRLTQAAGRERHDLTVTEINLFHIEELSYEKLGHAPYNLGWGHHHCNVVCKDAGIVATLDWMKEVLDRNST